MYLFEKCDISFSGLKNKIIFSGKRNSIFPDNTSKIIFQWNCFWKDHISRTFPENIIFLCIFFWERWTFIFLLKYKIIYGFLCSVLSVWESWLPYLLARRSLSAINGLEAIQLTLKEAATCPAPMPFSFSNIGNVEKQLSKHDWWYWYFGNYSTKQSTDPSISQF